MRSRIHAVIARPTSILHRCCALLSPLLLVIACERGEPAPAPTRPDAPTRAVELTAEGMATAEVRTARLAPQSFAPRLGAAATIVGDPQRIARVGARVAGRIAAITVTLGDQVRRGQSLVEVETAEIHEAVLTYLTAAARLREANDALARQRTLVAESAGSVRDLRRTEADVAATAAAFHEADEHLHFLGLTSADVGRLGSRTGRAADRSIVRAPIDGRVSTLDVSLGQVVGGTETIVTLAHLDVVWATLRVYERDLAAVEAGAAVTVQVPSYPERTFTGAVAFIGDFVDPVTRTVEVRASIANADGALRPGMSARASVAVRGAAGVLWLPAEAVQTVEGAAAVFVRTGERRFEARPVAVGPEQDGFVPVRSGASAGAEVVVHGAFALRGELERAEMEE